jgi:hypothetical protein
VEAAVIAQLKAIDAAEETFRSGNLGGDGKYATLAQLDDSGLLKWSSRPGNSRDYIFIKDGYSFEDIGLPFFLMWGVFAVPKEGLGDCFVIMMDHHVRRGVGAYGTPPTNFTTALDSRAFPIIETDGDIDGNGATEVSDAVLSLRYIAGMEPLTEEQFRRADVNQDSQVDILDTILLLKMALNDFMMRNYQGYWL